MALSTQDWLREQIRTLPSVRVVHNNPSAAVAFTVRTWVGMRIDTYFLDGAPNLRVLRSILQDNTRNYRGSLFVVHRSALPGDGERLVPEDWQLALHELNGGRIYTYLPGAYEIRSVHLDYLADGVECEAWHSDTPVTFEKLRVLNVSARRRATKGNWMIADFGPNPYWKAMDYRQERLRDRRNGRGFARNFTWGQYDMGGMPGGPDDGSLRRAHESELDRCYQLLGVQRGASKDDVKAAFRKLAREVHPDTSDMEKSVAESRFRQINEAYETIKSKNRW